MGWERRGSGTYYYRKVRGDDGRVRSEYVGSGRFAELIAASDRILREQAEEERQARADALAPIDLALALTLAGEAHVRLYRDAFLTACGYRRHRGQWRRRRGNPLPPFLYPTAPEGATAMPKTKTASRANARSKTKDAPSDPDIRAGTQLTSGFGLALEVPDAETAERLRDAILDAERGGSWAAVSKLRDELASVPPEAFGSFAPANARRAVAGLIARVDTAAETPGQNNGLVVALAEAEIDRTAREGEEPNDGPLVREALRHAALTGAVLDAVTAQYASRLRGKYVLDVAHSYEKRLTAAQARHHRALAMVSKLRTAERAERRKAARAGRAAAAEERREAREDRARTAHATRLLADLTGGSSSAPGRTIGKRTPPN